jgi:hypothetical protein
VGIDPAAQAASASAPRAPSPGAALIFVSARLKAALSGIWGPLLGFSEQSLFPDFDGFALAHCVDKPFLAEFIMDTGGPQPVSSDHSPIVAQGDHSRAPSHSLSTRGNPIRSSSVLG